MIQDSNLSSGAEKVACCPYTRHSNHSTLESIHYVSNVTPHNFKMTTHYDFFTAKLVEIVRFDSNKACKAGPLRGPEAHYFLHLRYSGAPGRIRTFGPRIKSPVLYHLATDAKQRNSSQD